MPLWKGTRKAHPDALSSANTASATDEEQGINNDTLKPSASHIEDFEYSNGQGDMGMQAPQATHTSNSSHGSDHTLEKDDHLTRADTQDTLAVVRTISRVPGNDTYYEKGGLRTYGDGVNHLKEDPWTWKRWMLFIAMGFLWTASQIPVYLYGGIIAQIETEIGGADRYVWILLAYLIPLASITPFVGPLADIFGRKHLSLFAVLLSCLGCIINSTAHTMNVFIGGMVLLGIAGGILELVALAVAGESAPTKKRGLYIGGIIMTIIPYCPSVLYAQLVVAHASWRYIGLWCGLWSFIGGVLTFFFYWPPPRPNAHGLSRWQIAKRIDATGGVLSTAGLTLFLMGLTWGGNQYTWRSAHVLVTVIMGSVFIVAWMVWEVFFVKYPMFPRRLGRNPRALTVILIITFVSGANFFAVLVFWPTQYFVTYANFRDPVSIGVGSLPVGFCIIGGSILFSVLISVLKGKIKLMMIISCVVMLAGNGAMAAATLDNLPGVYAAVSIACLGVGAVIVPSQIISTVVCPDDLIATITACTISVRFVGGAIAYAAYYNVLRQKFTAAAIKYIVPVTLEIGIGDPTEILDIILDISGNLASKLQTFPKVDSPEKVDMLVKAGQLAFSKAYPIVYYVSIAFGGAALVASCFLPDIDQFMDDHIAVSYAGQ